MRKGWVAALEALLAGAAICFALPPWGWWPLAPIGIVLWLDVLGHRRPRVRFALSYLVGIAWFAPSTLWMWGLTAPGYVAGVLVGWGPMVGVVGLLCPRDDRRIIALPAAIILFEWFHAHAPFGGAPISVLAMTQVDAPMLLIARLGGALLLSGAVATLGGAVYLLLRRRWVQAAGIVIVLVVAVLGGHLWPLGSSVGTIRIAGVQGGGPQGTRYSADQGPLVVERHLEATRTIDKPVDLVVWPEDAVNIGEPFATSTVKADIAAEAKRLDAPIIVGVVEDKGIDHFVNYVVVVNPDGSLGDRYDKERRVPFGEYVPLRPLFEPIAGDSLPQRDQIPGVGTAMLNTSAGPMAVVISWEVFFGRRAREGVRAGGQVLLNPTNGSSYWLTQVQSQQIAASQLRAVETGRHTVQVSPTGFSAFVAPDGTVSQRTDVSESTVIEAPVPKLDGTTPAQEFGDLPALGAGLRRPRHRLLARHQGTAPAGRAPLEAGHISNRRPRPHTSNRARHTSNRIVTGPSLRISTAMSVRNRPVCTGAPTRRSSSTITSINGSATSGRAAAMNDGRRPREVSA